MKNLLTLTLSILIMAFFLDTGKSLADWDPKNKNSVVKISHEIDKTLHSYHLEIEAIGLKHFDKDFSDKVHQLDHAIHDFHEMLSSNSKATTELILEDFKGVELKYREAAALFEFLAHGVHSNKKAGLGWLDFVRKYEELHFLVTGHFSWQDTEMDHHNHDHDHGIEHGADHGHDH